MTHCSTKKTPYRKRIAVLGCTGSVGTQVLSVARRHSDRVEISALVCRSSALLHSQISEFHPKFVGMTEPDERDRILLKTEFPETELEFGASALLSAACREDVDLVVVAATGLAALEATVGAIRSGKQIAFASKEILVGAGHLVMPLVKAYGVDFLPVDSEHSAIFQCIQGNGGNPLKRVILTASGGAFRDLEPESMRTLRAADALRHPTWNMGKKITVDCATMVNKGLEVIEAKWLFGLPPEKVDCILHRQSVIHSMAEFEDGGVLAQLSKPSMELPISYALFYPERLNCGLESLDFGKIGNLTFEEIDPKKYPSFALARECLRRGGYAALVFNAANEVAVEAFLEDRIGYIEMNELLEGAMTHFDFGAQWAGEQFIPGAKSDSISNSAVKNELERVYYIDGEVKALCKTWTE